ncbi:MAG: DUF4176 domain-containing protein [Atopobiaceae bacterium]|nr:DUF4176 domain-containing protein [Atopobiaceae bacterium]
MLDPNKDWLPLGSVVSIKGGNRLVMIIGFLAIDGNTRVVWDYVCCPYPEGKRTAEDLFINKESVDEVYQLGHRDAEGLAFEEYLESLKSESNPQE